LKQIWSANGQRNQANSGFENKFLRPIRCAQAIQLKDLKCRMKIGKMSSTETWRAVLPHDQAQIWPHCNNRFGSRPTRLQEWQPDEVAPSVVFLCTDVANRVTGCTYDASAGDSVKYTA